jgi:hypothetical protein
MLIKTKTILCCIIMLFLMGCSATNRRIVPDNERHLIKIIEVPKMSQDQIFDRVRVWMTKTFNDSKSVVEYSNKESGIITGKGVTNFDWDSPWGSAITTYLLLHNRNKRKK